MTTIRRFQWLALSFVVCAGCGSGGNANSSVADTQMGEIAAAIERVPDDTHCVALTLNQYSPNYYYRSIAVDVTPGDSTVIRFEGLQPGYGNVTGQAYSTACVSGHDAGFAPSQEFQTAG